MKKITKSLINQAAISTMVLGAFAAYEIQAKTYIVHMRSPTAFHKAADALDAALRAQGLGTRDLLGARRLDLPALAGTKAKTLEAMRNLNMLVVEADADDVRALQNNPDVNFIEEDIIIPVPRAPGPKGNAQVNDFAVGDDETHGERPWGIEAVRAPQAWDQGYKGQGMRVMVLDTGIDRDHPDLRNRFEAGRNFVATRPPVARARLGNTIFNDLAETQQEEPFVEVPYDYYDQNGHGTHCSGTILGEEDNEGVVGVAPQARVLMGRVCGLFGCAGNSIINGINWAVTMGVNVVSMSLGGPNNTRAQEEAVLAADRAGIVVVAATGNDSAERVSFPAASRTVLAVGAVDASLHRATFSNYGPELDIVGPGVDVQSSVPQASGRASRVTVTINNVETEIPSTSFIGAPPVDQPINGDLVPAGMGKVADFSGINIRGRIALIQRGEITFAEKVNNAITAGAAGAVIYNNVSGLMSGSLTEDGTEVAIPVVMIEMAQGNRLVTEIRAGNAQTLSLSIYKTNFSSFSGTSMATPHLAGVVALVRQANPALSPAQVRNIMKRSATHLGEQNPAHNEYGSGLTNAEAATRAAAQATPEFGN